MQFREEWRGVARDQREQLPRLQFEEFQLRCGMVRSVFRVRRWTVKTSDLREDPEIEMRIVVSPRDFTHQAHEISGWISRWCGVWMRWFKSYVRWRDVEPSPRLQTSRRSETQSPILSFVPGEAIFWGEKITEHGLERAGDIFSDVLAH